ncbi:Ca(2+)-dependent cysteine protease [Geranomyces michiganensis]|nr:Ca(2+)-dependent cysteine protease [Geranomyces michiganensis]
MAYPGQFGSGGGRHGQHQQYPQQQQQQQQQPQWGPPPGPPPPQQQGGYYPPPQGYPPNQPYQQQPYLPPQQQQQQQQQWGAPHQPYQQQPQHGYMPPGAPVPHVPPPHQPPPVPSAYQTVPHHPGPPTPAGWPQPPHYPEPPSQYVQQTAPYLSTCSGNKKALLIGINYKGTKSELRGCINDVASIKQFLTSKFAFPDTPSNMLVLTDDNPNWQLRPTRNNIIQAMQWLVNGTRAGDSLFFHFSGHGSQVKDADGDEDDGYDETICPEDYVSAGQITDDTMNQIMVRGLPNGARLTLIIDACHSGSAMDLPFTYLPDGTLKTNTAAKKLGSAATSVAKGFMKGGILGAGMSLMKAANGLTNQGPSKEQHVAMKGNQFADVILFSGCKDKQTSADASFGGKSAGAMTYGFTQALSRNHSPTYGQLLGEIRALLAGKFEQRPQLSSGRLMDMQQVFIM